MDRQTLDELFDYTAFTWASYGNALRSLPADALTRSIEGSGWPDLRVPLFHIAAGWGSWLRDRIGADDPLSETAEGISSWEDIEAVRERTRGWLRRVIDETPEADLELRTSSVLSDNRSGMRASVSDVLTHILMHERGHHGDVTTLLAHLGATPPGVDYLVFRWFVERRTES